MAHDFSANYVFAKLVTWTHLIVPVTIALLSIIALATAIQIVGLDFVGPSIWFVGMVSLGVAIAQRWCLTRLPPKADAAGVVETVQAPNGTGRQPGKGWGAVYWVYFVVPVFVIWISRTIFNATVACSKIGFDFAASLPELSTITNMLPAVVLETYYWGLALVGGMSLAGVVVLTALYSLYVSLCTALPRSEGGVLSLVVIGGVGVLVFVLGYFCFSLLLVDLP